MRVIKRIINKIVFEYSISKVKCTLCRMYKYLEKSGVKVLYVQLPIESKIKGLTDFEKERLRSWAFNLNQYKTEIVKLKRIYGDDITEEYIMSIFDGGIVVQGEKRKVLLDFVSENQHIINGRRITIGNPDKYGNTIYTHGACTWRGTGVEDSQTIASYLQALINDKYPQSYKVVNSAIGRGSTIFDDFQCMKEQTYTPGDIVIVGSHGIINALPKVYFDKIGITYIETSFLFDRPHQIGEWFNDETVHTNFRGNKVIAQYIYTNLELNGWLSVCRNPKVQKVSINKENITKGEKIYGDNPDLLKYIDSIRTYKKGDNSSRNGSIVMNCNPFTLGHRYLIEYAASRVDYLYIFVVEENKSYFPFEDRYKLVQQGTADLPNVVVLPSGNFIISAVTFPGYFYKDDLKETKIDCSNDLNVFAQYIAPALNIKVRFAGEEPLDPVTKQYNEGMSEILPQHGMEFCEIPRKKDDEGVGVISASRVRKCLEAGKMEELKPLVPQTTYNYLVKRYKREHPDD